MTFISYEGYQPAHLSFSTIDGYRFCGMRTKLQKVLRVSGPPSLAAFGGNVLHTATEEWDRQHAQGFDPDVQDLLNESWDATALDYYNRNPEYMMSEYIVTGRAAAKYGGKRNHDWWRDNLPDMVQKWIDWRLEADWMIPTIHGELGIELGFTPILPNGIPIQMHIDRLFVTPGGVPVVLDLKGLSVDTPLATPSGWTTMGEVQVGDEVFGKDGRPCRVTAKSERKMIDCYRVTFDDKSSIICDAEHIWEVTRKKFGRRFETANLSMTEVIARTNEPGVILSVDMPSALNLPEVSLPVDPYVYGAWLGDGHHMRGVITKNDQELFDKIAERGYLIGIPQFSKTNGGLSRTVLGLQNHLREAGLLGDKHIPPEYLRASVEQRVELLRGLMDTDGTYNTARKGVTFYTCDKGIALAAEELVLSLGERPHLAEVMRTGFGKTVTSYDLSWRPQVFNPFHLPRKRDQVDMTKKSVRSCQRIIQKVEPIPTVPTQCIAVDSVDHLYLAGHQMVPTHNTGRTPETPEQLGLYAWGCEVQTGVRPQYGYFWSPDKGLSEPYDLERYTGGYFAEIADETVAGMNAGCFLAKPQNSCKNWCSVAKFCPSVGGALPSHS